MASCVKICMLIWFMCCLITTINSAKILLIPGPHYSHVNFFSTAGMALKDNGHEVYVLTVKKYQGNVDKQGLHPIIDESGAGDFHAKMEPIGKKVTKGELKMTEILNVALPIISEYCKGLNRNKLLMDRIRGIQFDLVINDATMFYVCLYMIPYRLGLKYMSMSALHDPWSFGVSGMPSIEPSQLLGTSNKMSFFERALNIIPFALVSLNPMSFMYSQEHMEEFAPDMPYKSFKQLVSESQMVLINHDVICAGYPRVSAPHYRFIGGSSAKEPKPLQQDLQEFADGAKDGLIILSFGSIPFLQEIWTDLKPTVMNAFRQLRQRAIVQYGLDGADDAPANVRLVKWLPQNDLLGHPNAKIFITHGGNNGQLEAIYHGVPVLTMPFTGDQQYNALQAKTRGFGMILDRLSLTEKILIDSINELINNKNYSNNIKKCSEITKSMPSSQETTVFWVNHILRFGGEHLRSPAIDLPMYQVLMLDILAFFTIFLTAATILSISLCVCMFRFCLKNNKEKVE